MKTRRILAILLSLVLAVSLLAGCASSASDNASSEAVRTTSAASGIYDEIADSASGESVLLTEQKLIKTVDMEAETEDLDSLLTAISEQISQLGGYIQQQQIYSGSAYSSSRMRNADMIIRIPADSLDAFVSHVSGESNVVSRTETVDDVTLTYVDTESRVTALETEETRLLELLEQAETMSDLLEIESRLTEVRYELESYSSQLNVLENQISYSTVNLYISEVVEYTPVEEETVWQRISGGFMDSLKGLGNGAVEVMVFLLANLPYLVLLGAAVALVVFLCVRHRRKKQAKRQPPEPNSTETQ